MESSKLRIKVRKWTRNGHVGQSKELEMQLYLGNFLVKEIDTHGSMETGYYGSSAIPEFVKYVSGLCTEVKIGGIHLDVVEYADDKGTLKVIKTELVHLKSLTKTLGTIKNLKAIKSC